jgi:hypothetical protein
MNLSFRPKFFSSLQFILSHVRVPNPHSSTLLSQCIASTSPFCDGKHGGGGLVRWPSTMVSTPWGGQAWRVSASWWRPVWRVSMTLRRPARRASTVLWWPTLWDPPLRSFLSSSRGSVVHLYEEGEPTRKAKVSTSISLPLLEAVDLGRVGEGEKRSCSTSPPLPLSGKLKVVLVGWFRLSHVN